MARPIKQGLEYFPVDVNFFEDIKVRRIKKHCGIQSIPILIGILCSIYRDEGYYVGINEDLTFLIAEQFGVSEGAVEDTVRKAVSVEFFDPEMFHKYNILTSRGIQNRYFKAVSDCNRKSVKVTGDFLLVEVSSAINVINSPINSINYPDNPQSKEKESKEKKRKEEKHIATDKPSRGELFSWLDTLEISSELRLRVEAFIEMRKKIKKPLTLKALQLVMVRLSELSILEEDQIKILENSIVGGWPSVYPLKENSGQKSQGQKKDEELNDVLRRFVQKGE